MRYQGEAGIRMCSRTCRSAAQLHPSLSITTVRACRISPRQTCSAAGPGKMSSTKKAPFKRPSFCFLS